ncbi:MAG TPA: type II 3-dehydroquinate dehydratase [Polyangiaceae bacterium]|nr:type II 3-dehydroquinate dehydratase [Polyangiaceae bacterium]
MSPRGASRRGASGKSLQKSLRKILVLSGPNLDRLGTREPHIYGSTTLAQIHDGLARVAQEHDGSVECRQSNHEGDLVGWIGSAGDDGFAGILINAGSYTHTSYAIHDAIKGSPLPVVEVHVSNPEAREAFRHVSVIAAACVAKVAGFGADSYRTALEALLRRLTG